MIAPTQHPTAPADDLARTCDLCPADAREWRSPEGTARCRTHAETVPMAGPCQERAYREAIDRALAAIDEADRSRAAGDPVDAVHAAGVAKARWWLRRLRDRSAARDGG